MTITGIVVAPGPSFDTWLCDKRLPYSPAIDDIENYSPGYPVRPSANPMPRLYGCGIVPQKLAGLSGYFYGDICHVDNIPEPNSTYNRHCVTYSSPRNLHDKPGLVPFPDIPYCFSSGGMAFSFAAYNNMHLGVVGYDGYYHRPDGVKIMLPQGFIDFAHGMINHWKSCGRVLYSFMQDSIFNDLMIRCVNPDGSVNEI